jgi:hypothetical protein
MFKWFINKKAGSERNIMSSGESLTMLSVLFLALMSSPASSETTVYSWQDENGTLSFSDNPTNAPSDAESNVLAQGAETQTLSETVPTPVVAPQPPEPAPTIVTQGEFAVRLVEELGLAEDPTEEEAAEFLTSARISPKLGQWEMDQPMSPELTVRLRKLTVAAADRGWITLTPEQGLLAFDTASALMGLTIPVTTGVEEPSYSPVQIAETPPLVYVETPPPAIYPYYVWTPVLGGFWWNGFVLPGFFVLDVNIYVSDHHHRGFRGHPGIIDPGHIRRQFRSHIVDRQVKRSPAVPNNGRIDRSAIHPGPGRGPDRTIEVPISRDSGMRHSGSDQSKAQPDRRSAFPRHTATVSEIRHRSSSGQPDNATTEIKSSPSRREDPVTRARQLPPRPAESMPRVRPSPSRPAGPMSDLGRGTQPFRGASSPRLSDPTPVVRSLPPGNLPDRNINAPAAVQRQPSPSMDQRFVARPPQNISERVAERGPLGR